MKRIIITEGVEGVYGYETTYVLTGKNEVWSWRRHMKHQTVLEPVRVENPFPDEVWEVLEK